MEPKRSFSTRARRRSTRLTTKGGSIQTALWRLSTRTADRKPATPTDDSGSKTKTATLFWTTGRRNGVSMLHFSVTVRQGFLSFLLLCQQRAQLAGIWCFFYFGFFDILENLETRRCSDQAHKKLILWANKLYSGSNVISLDEERCWTLFSSIFSGSCSTQRCCTATCFYISLHFIHQCNGLKSAGRLMCPCQQTKHWPTPCSVMWLVV